MTEIECIRIDDNEQVDRTQNADAVGGLMQKLEDRITPASMVEYALLLVAVLLLASAV
jgi:hypothetical protein